MAKSMMRGVRRGLVVALLALTPLAGAQAAAPAAGTEIVNQASIRYTDGSGAERLATTNEVFLVIRQVYSATLAEDINRDGAAGKNATFYHVLTNTGNGTDTYTIKVANDNTNGDSGDFSGHLRVYQDANNNGQVDGSDIEIANTDLLLLGSITLNAQEEVGLIVQGQVPATAVLGDTYGLTLTATPTTGTVTDTTAAQGLDASHGTNEDTLTVTNDAVLEVYKSSTYDGKVPGTPDDDTISYTVTITNNGATGSVAQDIIVTDTVAPNTTFDGGTAITSSGVWDGATDGPNGSPGYVPTEAGGTLTGEVDTLNEGVSVTFTYNVNVNNGLDAGVRIRNTAQAQGDLDSNAGTTEAAVTSNETIDIIPQTLGVKITDTGQDTGGDQVNDGKDDDAANNIQLVDQANRSETVIFTNVVTNTGNEPDSYNLAVTADTFPPGTAFQFFAGDGFTPLLDNNYDGDIDSGVLAPGASTNIVVKAILPPDGVGNNGGLPWTATVTARSGIDQTVINTVEERLANILGEDVGAGASGVDVDLANTNYAPGTNGFVDGGVANADAVAGAATTSQAAVAGRSVTFNLYVANEGPERESYALSAWSDAAATELPGGWQVVYRKNGDEIISSTDLIDPDGVFALTATVTIPGDASPGTQRVYFKVVGNNNQTSDIKYDEVVVSEEEAINLSHDQSGTIPPCGTTDYTHMLTNSGNTTEDIVIGVAEDRLRHTLLFPTGHTGTEPDSWLPLQDILAGGLTVDKHDNAGSWSSVNLLNSTSEIQLAPGESISFKVRVLAPCSTPEQTRDALTVTATVQVGSASVSNSDITHVQSVYTTIGKLGALDAGCDGTADTGYSTSHLAVQPNQCVIWRLTIANQGIKRVCNVTVHDQAPAFTVLDGAPSVTPAPSASCGCSVSGANISCAVGQDLGAQTCCLEPGEKAYVYFRVRVE